MSVHNSHQAVSKNALGNVMLNIHILYIGIVLMLKYFHDRWEAHFRENCRFPYTHGTAYNAQCTNPARNYFSLVVFS